MTSPAPNEPRVPGVVRRCVPEGERVVRVLKPHPLFIALRSLPTVLACAVLITLAAVVDAWIPLGVWLGRVVLVLMMVALVRVVWEALEWVCRWYARTDRRVVRIGGVLRRVVNEVPIDHIRASVADLPVLERIFGLGSIGFATSGTDGYEMVWATIAAPSRELVGVRSAGGEAPARGARPVIIGIAGGVGSGKSTVARAFERLGCVVSDSDKDTDAALAREDVRAALRSWWGDGVIREDGSVNRRAVAQIVFKDAEQRTRLEGLIHPMVHASRAARIAEASARGVPAVIIDAPLLFEAGVDAECDAVVFVETPLDVREARVRDTRGWSPEDLVAREKAQLPLEQKRDRSDYVIVNEGHEQDLITQADRVLQTIRTEHRSAAL